MQIEKNSFAELIISTPNIYGLLYYMFKKSWAIYV